MKTFEENKTIKELGIDTTREFIVVNENEHFNEGDRLILHKDDDTPFPDFKRKSDCYIGYMPLCDLYYISEEETFELGEPIAVSDESVEDAIKQLKTNKYKYCYTGGKLRSGRHIVEYIEDGCMSEYNHIAKIPKLKEYTMEQLQEKLGEDFKLITK